MGQRKVGCKADSDGRWAKYASDRPGKSDTAVSLYKNALSEVLGKQWHIQMGR